MVSGVNQPRSQRFALLAAGFCLLLAGLQPGCSSTRHAEGQEWVTGKKIDVFLDTGAKRIRLYLDDGELLQGDYVYDPDAAFTLGAGMNFGGGGIPGGVFPKLGIDGKTKVYALLRSAAKPGLLVEIVADYNKYDGSGQGEARTSEGRTFKLRFGK